MSGWFWLRVAIVVAGAALVSGCNVGIGECHANDGQGVMSGAGGGGGEGGTGGSGGAGGGVPFSKRANLACAVGLSAFPLPPAQAIGTRVDFEMPDGARLTAISVKMDPADGHADLPAVMPTIMLGIAPAKDASQLVIVGTSTDNAATVANFEAPHDILLKTAPPGIVIDNDVSAYAAIAIPEGGAGALSFGVFHSWICHVDLP